jgi:hypothetical protein
MPVRFVRGRRARMKEPRRWRRPGSDYAPLVGAGQRPITSGSRLKTTSLRVQKSRRASARPHRMRTTPKTRSGVIGRGPRPKSPKRFKASAANRTAAIGNNQITIASYTPFDSGTGVAGARDARPGHPRRAGCQGQFSPWAVKGRLLSLPDRERGKPGRKVAGDLWSSQR